MDNANGTDRTWVRVGGIAGIATIFGLPGCALGVATLGLNLYSFPLPPEPDLGPIVALWICIVALRMLFFADYVHRGRFGLGRKK